MDVFLKKDFRKKAQKKPVYQKGLFKLISSPFFPPTIILERCQNYLRELPLLS